MKSDYSASLFASNIKFTVTPHWVGEFMLNCRSVNMKMNLVFCQKVSFGRRSRGCRHSFIQVLITAASMHK